MAVWDTSGAEACGAPNAGTHSGASRRYWNLTVHVVHSTMLRARNALR